VVHRKINAAHLKPYLERLSPDPLPELSLSKEQTFQSTTFPPFKEEIRDKCEYKTMLLNFCNRFIIT